MFQRIREYLSASLNGVRDRAGRVGMPSGHVVIADDHPAEDVLAYAHRHGFDLVVAGQHRSSRAGRFLLHGLTERLVDASAIPVLVVPEDEGWLG